VKKLVNLLNRYQESPEELNDASVFNRPHSRQDESNEFEGKPDPVSSRTR